MRRPLPLLFTALLLLLASCGDGAPSATSAGSSAPTDRPAQAAEAFLAAIAADDEAGYEARMTPAAVAALHADGGTSMNFNSEKLDSWEVGAETVDGDEAAVAVTITNTGGNQQISLKLRRHDRRWLVRGMAIPLGDDEWSIDFEGGDDTLSQMGKELATGLAESMTQAFADASTEWQAGGSAEQIAAGRASYDALASVGRQQHDDAWRVDVEAAGRSAADVIAELLEGSGLAMAAGDLPEQPSAISLEGVSRLAAIEAVCAEAGVVPVYPNGPSGTGESDLTFRAGARTLPVVFEGPFMIEASAVEENAPNTTGELTVTVRAVGLHAAVSAANQSMAEILVIDGLTGPDGRDLRVDDAHWMGSATYQGGLFSYSFSPDLTGLLRGVESMSLEGAVVLALPQEVHEAHFPSGPTQDPVSAGPWTVVWKHSGTNNRFHLTRTDGSGFRGSDVGNSDAEPGVRFAPSFTSGEPMGIQSESASRMSVRVAASLGTPEVPASLALKVFARREVRYGFRLEHIPLEHFAEQPVSREPLSFPGAAPLAVAFMRFGDRTNADFPKVVVRIHNPSNLVIDSAQVTFEYLDAEGHALKDFPHSLAGTLTFEGAQPLAAAGQTAPLETVAFFMPPKTADIRIRVKSVRFINGTTWEPEPSD